MQPVVEKRHIGPAIAAGLRARGIAVVTTVESGHEQASDAEQLRFARAENYALVTRDSDFLALAAAGSEHSGIVFWHSRRRSIGKVMQRLVALWRTTTAEELCDQIQFL